MYRIGFRRWSLFFSSDIFWNGPAVKSECQESQDKLTNKKLRVQWEEEAARFP